MLPSVVVPAIMGNDTSKMKAAVLELLPSQIWDPEGIVSGILHYTTRFLDYKSYCLYNL